MLGATSHRARDTGCLARLGSGSRREGPSTRSIFLGSVYNGNRNAGSPVKKFYVYILANRRYGVLYVGVTNSLTNRLSQHQQRLLPGFTSSYGVTRLVHFEEFSSVIEARARERSLKRWRRAWKLDLVDQLNPEWRDLAKEITG